MNKRAWGATVQNREEKFELKRQAVLLSAARLLSKSGYDKMSLADVAVDLGVAKPTVYYYFRNKEQIVRELMAIAIARLMDPDDGPQDDPNAPGLAGAQRFERFLRRCVRVISDDVGACLFVIYPYQLPENVRVDFSAGGQPANDLALAILRQGMADGSIAACDPVVIFNFVINALRGVAQLLEWRHAPSESLADAFVAMIMGGLLPRG